MNRFTIWVVGMLVAGVSAEPATGQEKDSMAAKSPAATILEQHTLEWMTIPGVVGTAEGVHRGKPCILVLVEKKTRELEKAFPEKINGMRVVLKVVGRVRKK
jgi:hypothetical protein